MTAAGGRLMSDTDLPPRPPAGFGGGTSGDHTPAWAVEILTAIRDLDERVGRLERLLTTGTVRRPRTAATEQVDAEVLAAVRSGARTLAEIVAASGRQRQRVCEARDRLLAAGHLVEQAGPSSGRGPAPRWFTVSNAA